MTSQEIVDFFSSWDQHIPKSNRWHYCDPSSAVMLEASLYDDRWLLFECQTPCVSHSIVSEKEVSRLNESMLKAWITEMTRSLSRLKSILASPIQDNEPDVVVPDQSESSRCEIFPANILIKDNDKNSDDPGIAIMCFDGIG